MKSGEKVFVAVSGGVDSSVSLFLLKAQGFDVTGVFIKSWQAKSMHCKEDSERQDAMRVCAKLEVPFRELDLNIVYRDKILSNFIDEYKNGRVPNPDVLCNKYIKFDKLYEYAIENGAKYIATGHYAQVQKDKDGRSLLFSGIDNNKDQSYFLWAIDKNILGKVLFPVGGYVKKDIRKIAESRGLFTHSKRDSQGICFLGEIDLFSFLSEYVPMKEGDVVYNGEVIGRHKGVHFYTIGQRHGFDTDISNLSEKFYVVDKKLTTNKLIVDKKEEIDKYKETYIRLRDINFFREISEEDILFAQYRYHGPKIALKEMYRDSIELETGILIVPGQSIVFYTDRDECIGGGVIL